MMRSVLVLGLLGCSGGGGAKTASSSVARPPVSVDVADAVVGKYFVYGVRGADPELVTVSNAGTFFLSEGRAFEADTGGTIRALEVKRRGGRAARMSDHIVSGAGAVASVVVVGDLVVAHARFMLQENNLIVAPAKSLKSQQLPWAVTRASVLPSTDVDGDGRPDLVTYDCADKCTVGFWRATATELDAEKLIASWDKQPRVVVGAMRAGRYLVAAVEPFTIKTYVLERGALRELAHVEQGVRDERNALDGPVAIGDFDRDQHLDIVVVSRGNALHAWSNGKQIPQLATVFQDRIRQVTLVDLDRDGDDDLLVATDSDVAMYRGSPSGLERSPSWQARLP